MENPKIPRLAIIILKYEEPEFKEQIRKSRLAFFDSHYANQIEGSIFFADRDGVGNMSRAFNEAYMKNVPINPRRVRAIGKAPEMVCDGFRFDYVWLVTNIGFSPSLPMRLIEVLENNQHYHAIHPAMETSDHPFLHPDGSDFPRNIPFIELTAPMLRADVLLNHPLDEMCPYYYMDLVLSDEIKNSGGFLAVHNGAEIDHIYLRNGNKKHPITRIREQLRNYWTPKSQKHMEEIYGKNWEKELRFKHYG